MRKFISAVLMLLMLVVSVTPVTAFASDAPCGITLFSEWDGDNTEFFTSITLTVTDRYGNPVQGAVYGLYKWDSTLVQYLTTDSYGTASTGELPSDTDYYLLELTTPEGYQPNGERKDIILSESCAPPRIEVTAVYDPVTGRIKVIKTDDNGNPVSGAGFYVYNSSTGALADTIITGADGTAVTGDLPYGRYELYEYLVPQGYEGGGYYSEMIRYDGETVEISIINYLSRGDLRIYKTGNDGRTVQGAVFSIYTASGEWIEDITTDSGGYAYSGNIVLGYYYAVEKSVPAPYALDETMHYFTLSYSGETAYLEIVNEVGGQSGKVGIGKSDDGNNPLGGVIFGIYRAWDNMKIEEITTNASGMVESGALIPGDYYAVELSGIDGYEFSNEPVYFTIDGSRQTVWLSVINPKIRIFGKVKVIKTDETGAPLSGVRFGVYCHLGNLLEELTTGANGTAVSGILNDGDYYIRELDGLPGYLADTDEHHFSISENNVIVPVEIVNNRIMSGIRIVKTDGENPLSGVVFGVYDNNGVKVCELITSADGTAANEALYYGAYELRELSAPEGFILLTEPIPFEIRTQGETVELTVINEREPIPIPTDGRIKLIKVDAETGERLSGAVFGVHAVSDDVLVCELITDANGEAVSPLLTQGGYYLKELASPDGYELVTDMFDVTVIADETVEITVANEKTSEPESTPTDGRIKLIKVDGATNGRLTGAVFGVYRTSDNVKVCELTTDIYGEAVSPLIPKGEYYLKELSAPDGYETVTDKFGVTVIADETVEITVTNEKTPEPAPTPTDGRIKLIKVDGATNGRLTGAVFGVYRTSDNVKVCELTTDIYGEAVSPLLPKGDYYLKEQSAPSGYNLTTDKYGVTIKADNTAVITIANTKTPAPTPEPDPTEGRIKLIKVDGVTNGRLAGAVFGVYRASDNVKVCELTTDIYGEAVSPLLPKGDYYLKEQSAPSGYNLSADKFGVTVKADNTAVITIANTKTPEATPDPEPTEGRIKLIKVDSVTGSRLSGAVFGVYTVSSNIKVCELITDIYGEAVSPLLTQGEYYLRETKAPAGYELSTEKYGVTVKADNTAAMVISNVKSTTTQPTPDPTPTPTPEPNVTTASFS